MSLSNYIKKRELGSGSFGSACLYENRTTKENVVIKEVDLRKMNFPDKENARKETTLLSQMNHQNIVKYFDSFEENGKLFIVMEYCDAGDMHKRINCQGGVYFPEDKILDWVVQICLGIKHIHDRKILHRDIKSQNIFMSSNDRVKIGDFGVAKALSSTISMARTCIGTPYYLSPEICNRVSYNNKCDIWSLGCVIYEITALDFPFKAANFNVLKNKITRQDFAPLPPKYSYDIRHFISLLLKKDPNQRPNINAILRKPLLRSRIEKFMSEEELKEEFSHTVLHGKNVPNKVRPKTPITNKRPASAQSAVSASKVARPVVKPPENKRIQPVNVRLNEAAKRRMEIQKNVEAEKKKKEREERLRQIQEKHELDKINRERELGWQNSLSSGSQNMESPRVPDPFSPHKNLVPSPQRPNTPNNNRLASPRVPPQPATPNLAGKYEAYNAELDKLNQEREERAKNFNFHNNKEKYMDAPVVKPVGGPSPIVASAEESAKKGNMAAGQARVVEEYLERQAMAARIKAQAMGGAGGAFGMVPQATPLSHKEKEYRDRLDQIRLQNFRERRGLVGMDQAVRDQDSSTPSSDSPKPSTPSDIENEERRKKIQELKKQAEERSRILKEQLEVKRQIAYENARRNANIKPLPVQQDDSSPIDNMPAIKKELSDQKIVVGPCVSYCLDQLNDTPPKPVAVGGKAAPNDSVDESAMKKIKKDILKEVNDKYNDGRGKWGVYSPDGKSKKSEEAFDFLRQRDLEATSSKMEQTYHINDMPVVNQLKKNDADTKRSWQDGRLSMIQKLSELPIMDSSIVDKEFLSNAAAQSDLPSPESLSVDTINIQPPVLCPNFPNMPPPELIQAGPHQYVSASPQLSNIQEISTEISASQTLETSNENTLAATTDDIESILDDALLNNAAPVLANIHLKSNDKPVLLNKGDVAPKVTENRPVEISCEGEGKLFNRINKTNADEIKGYDNVHVDDMEEDAKSDLSQDKDVALDEKKNKEEMWKPSRREDESSKHEKIASLKNHLTTGKFDSKDTSILRTCSLPDLSLLKDDKPVPILPQRLRSNSSSVCSNHENGDDLDLNDDLIDQEEEEEDIASIRKSMQQVLLMSSSSEDLHDTVQELQHKIQEIDEDENEEGDDDIGDTDEDFGDPSPNDNDVYLFIESERQELERLLGIDLLMQAYEYIQNETDDAGSITDDDSSEVAVKEMLGSDLAYLYDRICGLVEVSASYVSD